MQKESVYIALLMLHATWMKYMILIVLHKNVETDNNGYSEVYNEMIHVASSLIVIAAVCPIAWRC
jgi:hypothetical protein